MRPFVPPADLTLRAVRAKDPEVRALYESVQELVQQLEARFAASYFHGLPIGVPFPLLAGRFSDLTLGERFVKCDGKLIVAKDSPLNGQNAPVIVDTLGSGETVTWMIRVRD